MVLNHRLQSIDDPAGKMIAHSRRQRGVVSGGDLHIVMRCIVGVGSIDSNYQHRPRFTRSIGGTAMDGQCRPRRNVTALRQIADRTLELAGPKLARREHRIGAVGKLVPLRPKRDLERPVLGLGVDRGQVERERIEPPRLNGGRR